MKHRYAEKSEHLRHGELEMLMAWECLQLTVGETKSPANDRAAHTAAERIIAAVDVSTTSLVGLRIHSYWQLKILNIQL